jgi:hypothetical protein
MLPNVGWLSDMRRHMVWSQVFAPTRMDVNLATGKQTSELTRAREEFRSKELFIVAILWGEGSASRDFYYTLLPKWDMLRRKSE